MTARIPLPNAIAELIGRYRSQAHPGLLLDKFVRSWDPQGAPGGSSEKIQRPAVEDVVKASRNGLSEPEFSALSACRRGLLTDAGLAPLRATTTGPLTLHLARASALENAGICLHPLYGFVYLPGSGLKGMARAYAETIWLGPQSDQRAAWRAIEDVFGWAPNPERAKQIQERDHPAAPRYEDDDPKGREISSCAGNIVFHDAWPTKWPELIVDIVNNHHSDYYQASEGDNSHPPGDWEDPIPVYFLAVPAGATFDFVLAKRRAGVADECLTLARQWLEGALCHLGAGGKTAAGYGSFKLEASPAPVLPPTRKEFTTTLELVTPAFLAGASQQKHDCDLRSATLRGLLRWWWRTMHAGFVDTATLRRMEALVWGDTKQGGAVRIELRRGKRIELQKYSKRSLADMSPAEKVGEYGLPGGDAQKTTQGLWYASYGMDDKGKPRWYLEAGSSWELRVTARGGPTRATAQQFLEQGLAALWLLCQYGGVGAKSRKGFGSLSATQLDGWNAESCRAVANEFRETQAAAGAHQDHLAESPSLEQLLPRPTALDQLPGITARFDWSDVWGVLDQVGFAYQACAKKYAHRREKQALGLPRRIGSGSQDAKGNFRPTGAFAAHLATVKNRANARHASPVHFHVDHFDGAYVVRAVAFPAAGLPDLGTSRSFLNEFLGSLAAELERRSGLRARQRRAPPSAPQPGRTPAQPGAVRVKVIGPHEKLKGACWVQEPGKNKGLVKYGKPPDPLPQPGAEITVYATNQTVASPEYRWDRPAPPPPPRRGGNQRRR